jgi:transcriptional regulator with XRE-family HTH domain
VKSITESEMSQYQIGNKSEIFSARLKELRGARKKAEFSRFLGIKNTPTYFRYEDGRIPEPEIVQEIADRCDVSPAWLLGYEERRAPGASIIAQAASQCKKSPSEYADIPLLALKTMVKKAAEQEVWEIAMQASAEILKRQSELFNDIFKNK